MTSSIETTDDNKASQLMRKAILRELHCPPDDPNEQAADKLEPVARSLVNKTAQGDVTAIKEALDRIDGRSPAGVPEADETAKLINIRWGSQTAKSLPRRRGPAAPAMGEVPGYRAGRAGIRVPRLRNNSGFGELSCDEPEIEVMTLKSFAAAACAAAIVSTSFFVLPADARVRKDYRYEDRYAEQRGFVKQQRYAQPLSIDGRNTGRARTCGSDTFVYDGWGVPTGPYCH